MWSSSLRLVLNRCVYKTGVMITEREGTILPGAWDCLPSLEKRGGIVMRIERQGTVRQSVKYRGMKACGATGGRTQKQSTESLPMSAPKLSALGKAVKWK